MLGFPLNEIAQIIKEKRAGQNPCAEVRKIVRERLRELGERVRETKHYRKELTASLAILTVAVPALVFISARSQQKVRAA